MNPFWRILCFSKMGVGSTTKTSTVVGMHFPHVGVSENGGTPKSSILIVFSLNKPSILGYPYCWKHPYIAMLVSAECYSRHFFFVLFFDDSERSWLATSWAAWWDGVHWSELTFPIVKNVRKIGYPPPPPRKPNTELEHPPFEDVFGDLPLPCEFLGV